jgi:tetratricopeptide (TPR) repeat protein
MTLSALPASCSRDFAVLALCLIGVTSCGTDPQKYIARGNRFFDVRQYDAAELQYQKALQKSPNSGEAWYRLALVEMKRGHSSQAYVDLQRAVELAPDNIPAISRQGQLALIAYSADRNHPPQLYQQATADAKRLLERQPSGYDGNLLQGSIDLVDKKPAEAAAHLRQAIKSKPDDPDATLILARALVDDNQRDAGMDLVRQLIGKNKAFGPGYDFLFEQYTRAGEAAEAEKVLRQKVDNNPKESAFVLELGRYYESTKRPSDAASALKKLTDNPKDFPNGRLLAGDFYNAAGQPALAMLEYDAGLAKESKDKNLYRRRMAVLLAAQKRWPEVYSQLQQCLKTNPEDQEAKLMRALAWLNEGKRENLDSAIVELSAQLKGRPADAGMRFQLGNALSRKGDQDGARREWAESARQNRRYLPPRYALAQMDLAQGKSQDALRVSEEILAVAPGNAQARALRVTCQIAAGQLQQAKSDLSRMAREFPQSARVLIITGELALAEKRYADAERIFMQLASSPMAADPEVLSGMTRALMGQKEPAKALQELEDAVKRNPASLAPREVLAQAAMSSGKYDIAVDQYKQLAAAAPGSIEIQRDLAAAYRAEGDVTAAIGILEAATQKYPSNVAASLDLAHLLYQSGRLGESKDEYRRLLKIAPDNPNALNDLAYVMTETGENTDQALALVRKGMEFATDQRLKSSLQDTLGSIYLKKNMLSSALQSFQVAVNNNPGSMTYRYHLGTTFYQMGNKPQAKAELKAALEATPKSQDELKIRELLAKL